MVPVVDSSLAVYVVTPLLGFGQCFRSQLQLRFMVSASITISSQAPVMASENGEVEAKGSYIVMFENWVP